MCAYSLVTLYCRLPYFSLTFFLFHKCLVVFGVWRSVGQKDLSVSQEIGSRWQYLTRCTANHQFRTLAQLLPCFATIVLQPFFCHHVLPPLFCHHLAKFLTVTFDQLHSHPPVLDPCTFATIFFATMKRFACTDQTRAGANFGITGASRCIF